MPSNEIQKRNIERRELRQLQRLDKISELRKEQTKLKK